MPAEIFNIIVNSLSKNPHFELIAASEGSFEQWINWEAYAACVEANLNCVPMPHYSLCGLNGSRLDGDLLVTKASAQQVMIETKIIGDYTLDKYLDNISEDRNKLEKLKQCTDGWVEGLQFIVMYSMKGGIMGRPSWTDWLQRLSFWNIPPTSKYELPLKNKGQVLLYGWAV
jgi:hypothetical protein